MSKMNNKIIIRFFYAIQILYFVDCAENGLNTSNEIDTILDGPEFNLNEDENNDQNQDPTGLIAEYDMEIQKEQEAGDVADLFGTNQHYNIPVNYQDLGRRFVLSYPYFENEKLNYAAEAHFHNSKHLDAKKEQDRRLKPVKAPPEFVLSIAKQSALLEASKPKNPTDDIIRKNILRTGDYWDNVWKEDVDMKQLLRMGNHNDLEPITVEISPGSKLYDLIVKLKEKSPRLLYVINKD